MKRVHESVDYIVHPDRKMQQFVEHPSTSHFLYLQNLASLKIEGFSFVKKQNTVQYTVFKLRVVSEKASWAVFRRYSEFNQLYEDINRQFDVPQLPPKRMFGHFSTDFLVRRQQDLEKWINKVLFDPRKKVTPHNEFMRAFLTRELVEMTGVGELTPSAASVTVPKPSVSSVASSSYNSPEQSGKNHNNNNDEDKDMNDSDSQEGEVSDELMSTQQSGATEDEDNAVRIGLDDFDIVRVLGKGSFGKVMLCRKKDTQKLYAMKVLKKKHVLKKKQLRHAKTERSVLEYLNHPFIVKLYYAFQTNNKLHFIIDYLPGGELFFHLGRQGRFKEPLGRFYTAEIALALGHLHENEVVYRDLKPENILLDFDGHIKLADFGLSKEGINSGTEGTHSFCGTPEYLAPEVLNRSGHGTAVDWWSLGALLYEMLTGLPPWYSQDRRKMFAAIRRSELCFPDYISPSSKKILEAFLERDAVQRLGSRNDIEEVKQHLFFENLDWDKLLAKELQPPFVPEIDQRQETSSNPDTTNFDQCFTRLPVHSVAEMGASSMASNASLGRLGGTTIGSLANAFNGFTFVEPSHLQQVMEESPQVEDDEEMDKHEDQMLLEQHLLNLHDTNPTSNSSTSPSGLSSSLLFK